MEDGNYSGDWTMYTWAICGQATGHQIVATSAVGGPDYWARTSASCPVGKKVIGSGAESSGGFHYMLTGMFPNSTMSTVEATAMRDETNPTGAWGVRAYAICINPLPGQVWTYGVSGNNSADKGLSITCPAGTFVHGTGAEIQSSYGQVSLDRVGLNGISATGGVDAYATEDDTGTPISWGIVVAAICAP
jgi:hypothetical protein